MIVKFRQLINRNSYLLAVAIIGAGLLWFLLRDGFSASDLAWLGLVALASLPLFYLLRTPPDKIANFATPEGFDSAVRAGRPSLVEFYSERCAVCMANRPVLDRLEQDTDPRLQVVRLDLDSPTGKIVARRFNVLYSPTFLLFDGRGEKQDEFLYAINPARVRYWLEHQNPAA